MKLRPVGAEVFHVDRQKDRHDEANSRLFAILRTCLKTNRKHSAHRFILWR
jgi:hypothetical protein